jgi:hypothetical protein
MTRPEADLDQVLMHIRGQAASDNLRVTLHAHREMVDENISLDEVLEAFANGMILEDYPEHQRGACCLLYGRTGANRPLHIVCTTSRPTLIIITVYEPLPPKWVTPTQRRR